MATILKKYHSHWDDLIKTFYLLIESVLIAPSKIILFFLFIGLIPLYRKTFFYHLIIIKSENKRQIMTEDIVEYKMKLLKELLVAYEKLSQDKIKESDVYKTNYDNTHQSSTFNVAIL